MFVAVIPTTGRGRAHRHARRSCSKNAGLSHDAFTDLQRAYYRTSDGAHFAWQTRGPYFAATEAALLAGVRAGAGERLLEVGCGEGGNLFHLRDRAGQRFGVDFSPRKAAFARRAAGALVAAADAAALPFPDATFHALLIRDLLHHLPDRGAALREARRVLRPGGRLTLIEPNARAPLALLQALTVPAERGILRSTAARIRRELSGAGFTLAAEAPMQALPLARIVLHPRLGRPRLGGVPQVARALRAVETAAERLVPRAAWLYLTFQAVRP